MGQVRQVPRCVVQMLCYWAGLGGVGVQHSHPMKIQVQHHLQQHCLPHARRCFLQPLQECGCLRLLVLGVVRAVPSPELQDSRPFRLLQLLVLVLAWPAADCRKKTTWEEDGST